MFKHEFKKYFFSKIFFNFFTWIFVALSFFVIALAADRMEMGKIGQKPIEGIASFVNWVLIFATVIGLVLMTLFALLMKGIFLNGRVVFKRLQQPDILSDEDAREMVLSEVLGQLNSLANLSLAICLFHWIDVLLHTQPVFVFSIFDPATLITTSVVLYGLAFLVFFASVKLDKAPS